MPVTSDPTRQRAACASRAAFCSRIPARELSAQLWLRDADGAVFDLDPARLSAKVSGGRLAREIEQLAPGLYRLVFSSPAPALDDTLRVDVRVDARSWLAAELPVVGDVERRGDSLGGGCSASARTSARRATPGVAGLALLVLLLAARLRAIPRALRAVLDLGEIHREAVRLEGLVIGVDRMGEVHAAHADADDQEGAGVLVVDDGALGGGAALDVGRS